MSTTKITADQLHCLECGTIIPKGQRKCPNPRCPTNQPIRGYADVKFVQVKQVDMQEI